MPGEHTPSFKFDRLRRQAEELIDQGSHPAVEATTDILDLINELNIHQAELEIQNEELKRAQQELNDLYLQYENLYEFAPCGYLSLNPKGRIIRINLAGATLLKGLREKILLNGFSQFVAPDWIETFLDALRKTAQTGQKQSLEMPLRTANLTPAWVWTEIQADQTQTGRVLQYRMALMDISAKKQVENALRESERKYRQWFDHMVSAAVLMEVAQRDSQGRVTDVLILEVNRAYERLTGRTRQEVVGRCVRQIWPQTEKFWFEHVDRALRDPRVAQVEGFHAEIGKHLLFSLFKMDDRRLGTTFIDISARKKIEEALEKSRCDLEALVQKRTAELRRVNRELRGEVASRKQAQIDLLRHSEALKQRTTDLEEANAALKVLLKERDADRRLLEEKVASNLEQTVRPQLDALAAGQLSPRQKVLLKAVLRGLDDILSPLNRRFIIDASRLTPTETTVANLIRQGQSTKQIAALMGVATSTVDFHRRNIRRKLHLTNKGVNLQSHLHALT